MKNKRPLLILLSVLFFLTALTFYLNRVVFPVQLKKIAVQQAENFLKRKVEIGSLHFSWVKGLVLDQIEVYQKDSDQVFVQAQQVSLGIVWVPGLKQQHISIPFLNIDKPSVHVVRTGDNLWNFSDLLPSSTPAPAAKSQETKTTAQEQPKEEKPSPVTVNLVSAHIIDGTVKVDDFSNGRSWSQVLDHINLKTGFSYKGITFDFSAAISAKEALIAAQGTYGPLDQTLQTQLQIKNIKPAEYLAFIPPIAGLKFNDGLIQDININVNYAKESIKANGDLLLKGLDAQYNDQSFKGSIEAHHADIDLKNGDIKASGDVHVLDALISAGGMQAAGSLISNVNEFKLTKENLVLDGNFNLNEAVVQVSQDHTLKGTLSFRKVRLRRDKDGTQLLGTLSAEDVDAKWGPQAFKGNLLVKPITLEMKNVNDISLTTDLKAEHVQAVLGPGQSFGGDLNLENINLHLTNYKNFTLSSKVGADNAVLTAGGNQISGHADLPSLNVNFADGSLSVKSSGKLTDVQINAPKNISAAGNAEFAIDAQGPVQDLSKFTYNGTLAIHKAQLSGSPVSPIKDIDLDAVVQTNQFTIKLMSLTIMDTAIKAAGTVMDFKNPVLNIEAASDKFDLAKLKDLLPGVFEQYGLQTSGEASFNVKFQGMASDPLSGKINAKAQLNNVNASSSKFNQSLSSVSGTVEGSLDSLSWNNFTGTYLGKTYTLTGSLTDFKNPKIKTTLDGQDVQLKVDLSKKEDIVTINNLEGKYFKIAFSGNGNVTLPAGGVPVLDVNTKIDLHVEDLLPFLPADQRKNIKPLKPSGAVRIEASIKGKATDWKNWTSNVKIDSPALSAMGFNASDTSITLSQFDRKISNLTLDTTLYDGKVHAVASSDLDGEGMPFDLALNVDGLDIHKFKNDIPTLKSEEINGKFYLTALTKGKLTDLKNVTGKGSLAIREGFLTEFKFFKGLLGILNEVLKLGQVTITDVEGNFELANQKITTDNLRLKGPTIVLLTQGWVDLDQNCDLNVTVDTTSGIIPAVAENMLQTLKIHIYDKIGNPRFDKKISVPQVINSIIKTIGIFQ